MRRRLVPFAVGAVLLGGAFTAWAGHPEAATPPVPAQRMTGAAVPAGGRIAVMVLENRSYREVIGNPSVPYINALARRGALATRYYAIGHPSLPNYVALTTGGHSEVNGDCAACATDATSLLNQLDVARISWRAYFESMPAGSARGSRKGARYNGFYNPFAYTESVAGSPVDRARILNFDALDRALRRGRLPRFTWIAPNVEHDGHNSALPQVDAFAAATVPRILRALGPDGVLLITWDEGPRQDHAGVHGTRGGGHIPLIAVGPGAARHRRVATPANHYALLRTIEAALGLRALGTAASPATPTLPGLFAVREPHGGSDVRAATARPSRSSRSASSAGSASSIARAVARADLA
jgi:hypothetical protein